MRVNLQSSYHLPVFHANSNQLKTQNKKISLWDKASSISGQVNVSFKDAVTFGGHDDYSKEDAINHAWFERNAIRLEDVVNGKKIELPSSTPPSDFVKSLEQSGSSPKVDFLYAELDFNSMSSDKLKRSVDYVASRYAVMRDYISTNFNGEEQTLYMKNLNDMMDSTKEKLAKTFSDKVGGFFEEYGVSGEKENTYQSVLSEFYTRVTGYSEFIKSNENYADIDGTREEWLKNDSAYMASELRKTTKGTSFEKVEKSDSYTLDELDKMQTFTKEMEDYSFNAHGSGKRINAFGTEEEIGMQLSEVVLKGDMFNKYANVSKKVQDVVSKSIDNFITKAVEEVQKHIDNEIKLKGTDIPSKVLKGLTAIDKQAIYDVIGKVKTTYASTGNFYKSFLDGAIYADDRQNQKYEGDKVTGIDRYEQRTYWDNFFKNTDEFSGAPDILGITETGYIQKESGIASIVNSWNEFADKISSDGSAKLNTNSFSIYA